MKNRSGKTSGVVWIALVVMGVLVMGLAYKSGYFDKFLTHSASVATTDTGLSGNSQNHDTSTQTFVQPSLTVTPHDQYNGTTFAGSLTLFVSGIKSTGTAGTAFNTPADASVEAVWDDGQHYTSRFSGTGPKNGNVPGEIAAWPNGTLSSTFYNSAGTASTAQALVPGDVKYVKALLTSENKRVYSNPDSDKNPIICFDYNTTEIDTIEVVGSSPAPMPQQAVGTYEECDYAPFKSLSNGQEQTIQILVDADDTVNPVGDATMIIYDQDLYLKTKTPVDQRVFGVENDAGTDIGGVNPTVTLDFS